MSVEEFVRARTALDGRHIVLISEHKTGAQSPAQLALEPAHHKLFALYVKRSVSVQFYCVNIDSFDSTNNGV